MEETKTLEELKAEATALGITFNPKIGVDKLTIKIEEHYNSLSAEDSVKSVDDVVVEIITLEDTNPPMNELASPIGESDEIKMRRLVGEAKAAAMATKIVTISSNDKRDSEYATTCYLSMENQFFGVSKLVPLDVPVELEQCLIDVAKSTEITLHKDEIVNGRRTGNKVPVRTRKFNISYDDIR